MMNNKKFFVLTSIFFISIYGQAQDSTALFYSGLIKPETISRHLYILASDSLEGRETAKPGMQKAAAYVSAQFSSYGMKPVEGSSFFQHIPLVIHSASAIDIVAGNRLFEPGIDFYSIEMPVEFNLKSDQVIFAGYGIIDSVSGWNDYNELNVEGKIVLIADGEPVDREGKNLITKSMENSPWKLARKTKINLAKQKKAAAIFYISNEYDANSTRMKRWLSEGKLNLESDNENQVVPVIYINLDAAEAIFNAASTSLKKLEAKAAKGEKSMAATLNTSIQVSCSARRVSCTNVLGYVEGSDLKDELIIISAHLDHLGKRESKIYYGADDDGSGCATILNMAEVFMKAKAEGKGPHRSILFITFSGEEKGLLGSEYYTENPVFPLGKTVANLNIDMIGRIDTIQRNTKLYTYIIGSDKLSTELHKINETANSFCCNLDLDYRYNDPADKLKLYYRSDHYNFAKKNVPVIFYFTGLHEDYHEPTDTVDKIDFEKTAAIGKLIFNTAWELVNRPNRISVDVKNVFE